MQRKIWVGQRVALAACAAAALIGFSPVRADINGFGTGAGYTINNNAAGLASISNGTLTLTTGVQSQASSVFNNTAQNIQNFTSSFTYTDVGSGGADGFAFVLQNDPRGVSALGDAGGSLGYAGGAGAGWGSRAAGRSVTRSRTQGRWTSPTVSR